MWPPPDMPVASSEAFRRAVEAYFGDAAGNPQSQFWRDYASSSILRGKDVAAKLLEFCPYLAGKRHLDIGSGYGGTCVAMGQRGASSLGLELDPKLIAIACTHLEDSPGLPIAFRAADVLDWSQLATLGTFDAISCDNVIEHVEVPDQLLAHVSRLLAPGGVAYLTAPNAWSIGQIRKDCHFGLFGITLLDPWDGDRYCREATGNSYGVSLYYPFTTYTGLFEKYGMKWKLLNWPQPTAQAWVELRAAAASLRQEAKEISGCPIEVAEKLGRLVAVYVTRLQTDLAQISGFTNQACADYSTLATAIHRDYVQELWYFILSKPDKLPD